MIEIVARWESKTGKHWAELHRNGDVYGYRGDGCGGCLGAFRFADEPVAMMERKVASGYFLPDSAKTPMHRVA